MPEVLVLRIVGLTVYLQRNIVRLGVIYHLVTRFYIPYPPGRDYRHVGSERLYAQLEPHLIVALSGAAVAYRVGAFLFGYLHYFLRDEGSCKRCAEQIIALVNGACLHGWVNIILDELLFKIKDVKL